MTNEEAIKILEVAKAETEWIAPLEYQGAFEMAIEALEKQIPKKPTEATDHAWGIPCRQAVCPECDCYLGQIHFIGDGQRKIAYCERCGQAVDFSEWEEDE